MRGKNFQKWSLTIVAICLVIPQRMRLSGTVTKIWSLKSNWVTILTFWRHMTLSVTWPFDSRGSTSCGWSIVTTRLSGAVTEIRRIKGNWVTTLTFWRHMTLSVTWPFDSRGSTTYGWSIVTMRLSSTVMEIWSFDVWSSSRKALPGTEVGRRSVGRSVLNITLISYTPLRYIRNVVREE